MPRKTGQLAEAAHRMQFLSAAIRAGTLQVFVDGSRISVGEVVSLFQPAVCVPAAASVHKDTFLMGFLELGSGAC